MEGDRRGTAAAAHSVGGLAICIRGVHVLPVRHHSPALARAVEEVIRAVCPKRVLVEGPADANPLIDILTDPQTVAPIAIMAYRPPETRGVVAQANLSLRFCFYPFCDYSPELVALRVARELGIPAQFCDIPASVVLARLEPPPPSSDHPTPPSADASIWGRAARRMGFRSGEEWWEAVFESGRLDTASLLRQVHAWGELVLGESPRSEYDALRNAWMWRQVEQVVSEGVPREAIVLVVGAAHSAAFARPDFRPDADLQSLLDGVPPAELVVIPYSFPRLSEQSGYGAGNRAPQFYQEVWEFGTLEMAACAALTRMVGQMKHQGDMASHADAIEAFRLAKVLAYIRSKAQPGVDEVTDACITLFGHGDARRVSAPLRRVLIGERVGRVPPHGQRWPLQAEFHTLAHQLGIPIKDEGADIRLNLAEPHAVQQSIFLHRLAVAGIPFAQYRGGEAATYQHMGCLREHWWVSWTPLTDAALAEAVRYGNTLREVACNSIRPKLALRDSLEEVSRAILEAVLCDLPELYDEALAALEEASVRDSDFVRLSQATYQVASMIEYSVSRSVRREVFEPLLRRLYIRACVHLPASARCGDEEARAVGHGMRLLDDLARRLADLDASHWIRSLRDTTFAEGTHPYLQGIGLGLLIIGSAEEEPSLLLLARRALSPGNPPHHATQFIEGLLQANPGVVVRSRPIVRWLHQFVLSIPRDHLIQALPMLRRAFAGLARSDLAYLIANLRAMIRGEVSSDITPGGLLTLPIPPDEVEELLRSLDWLCIADLPNIPS